MAGEYDNIKGMDTKYQGESVTRWYDKTSGDLWEETEVGYWELFDENGTVESAGTLLKSVDNKYAGFTVPKADTADLVGTYLLLLHVTHTDDTTFNDIIVEYTLTFKEEKAG